MENQKFQLPWGEQVLMETEMPTTAPTVATSVPTSAPTEYVLPTGYGVIQESVSEILHQGYLQ